MELRDDNRVVGIAERAFDFDQRFIESTLLMQSNGEVIPDRSKPRFQRE